jgi:hypothetical protein
MVGGSVAVRAVVLAALVVVLVGCGSGERKRPVASSVQASTSVMKTAAPSTGVETAAFHGLDFATAAFVADFTDEAGELCGEEDCDYGTKRCFRNANRRVDCVVGFIWSGGRWMCGLVVTVVLRGIKVYEGSYNECEGERLRPITRSRFIRPRRHPKLARFRAGIDWPAQDERNRYGVPRYDTKRDVYLPK